MAQLYPWLHKIKSVYTSVFKRFEVCEREKKVWELATSYIISHHAKCACTSSNHRTLRRLSMWLLRRKVWSYHGKHCWCNQEICCFDHHTCTVPTPSQSLRDLLWTIACMVIYQGTIMKQRVNENIIFTVYCPISAFLFIFVVYSD